MSQVLNFNSFKVTHKKIIEKAKNDLTRMNLQYYHHDFQSEPFLHIEAPVTNVLLEEVEDHGTVITILTPETNISFTENNYYTNLSNDSVVFSSKNDDETYCIIDFI